MEEERGKKKSLEQDKVIEEMRERGRNREEMKDEEENSSLSSQNMPVLRIQTDKAGDVPT